MNVIRFYYYYKDIELFLGVSSYLEAIGFYVYDNQVYDNFGKKAVLSKEVDSIVAQDLLLLKTNKEEVLEEYTKDKIQENVIENNTIEVLCRLQDEKTDQIQGTLKFQNKIEINSNLDIHEELKDLLFKLNEKLQIEDNSWQSKFLSFYIEETNLCRALLINKEIYINRTFNYSDISYLEESKNSLINFISSIKLSLENPYKLYTVMYLAEIVNEINYKLNKRENMYNFEFMIKMCDKIIQLNPEFLMAKMLRAIIADCRDIEQETPDIYYLLARNKLNYETLYRLAGFWERRRLWDSKLGDIYEICIKIKQDYYPAIYKLAAFQINSGYMQKGMKLYYEVLKWIGKKDKDWFTVRDFEYSIKTLMRLADLNERTNRIQEAIELKELAYSYWSSLQRNKLLKSRLFDVEEDKVIDMLKQKHAFNKLKNTTQEIKI